MEYILEGKNLKRDFIDGEVVYRVLKGINLNVKKGEFISIVGKSGTGKSTLIYQLNLLDIPTSGDVLLNGERVDNLSVKEKTKIRLNQFGFVFQHYELLPELTAAENIALPLIMQGVEAKDAIKKAVELMKEFELLDKVDKRPAKLSGGENQRVSVLRAVIHNPKIIFADEPTANLDTITSQNVLDLFKKLNEKGQTIIMVTHETEYADMADRKIVIEDGIIKDEVIRQK